MGVAFLGGILRAAVKNWTSFLLPYYVTIVTRFTK
jgi:hypothetical protein